jgi:hypothetical protein
LHASSLFECFKSVGVHLSIVSASSDCEQF